MAGNDQTLFRKKTIDKISSPEQLTDYLKDTSPRMWIILAAVIMVLLAVIVWGILGRMETVKDVRVIVSDGQAQIVTVDGTVIEEGMTVRIDGQEFKINGTVSDEFDRPVGLASVTLPDGSYDGTVVIDQTRAVLALFGNR
jgi:hypothetical protein